MSYNPPKVRTEPATRPVSVEIFFSLGNRGAPSRPIFFLFAVIIFLVAGGVRVLSWQDTRLEFGKVQSGVTADYKRVADLLHEGGAKSFFSPTSPLSNASNLSHPPGYSILMVLIHSTFGELDSSLQFAQIFGDALSAVVIFLIVAELLPFSLAIVAGILSALSPQFAWNSVLLLPDSLSVLPILLAVYCLARAVGNPRFIVFAVAGALVGISCWLRADAMLLTFFLATAVCVVMRRGKRWRYLLATVCGTLLIGLPLTIRNAVVFHHFIPLSLGAGQTLLEGIADYDRQSRFNIPKTDVGIMKEEANHFHRSDYNGSLFNPDGVERERARLVRGLAVIRSHPLWFASVMVRRAASMLRLERSRLVSPEPAVSHSLDLKSNPHPFWVGRPADLLGAVIRDSSEARVHLEQFDNQKLVIEGDASKYGRQIAWPIAASVKMDHMVTIPIQIERGRMRISITDADDKVYSTAVIETIEGKTSQDQPMIIIQLPFVSDKGRVQITLRNEASDPPHPTVRIGTIKVFELGVARFLWTRYPRFVIHGIQKIFLTAVMLPLGIVGLVLLIMRKNSAALILLTIVPLYYFMVQSLVHTEYRYILAADYFLLALAATTISWIAHVVSSRIVAFWQVFVQSGH